MTSSAIWNPLCPVAANDAGMILLAHGEGARLSRRLIREELLPAFDCTTLRSLGDAAMLPDLGGPAVLTTDGFVVTPLFFPGGDIGRLAVHGTINDLAVAGAEPMYLSVGLILEEGLPLATLRQIVASIRDAARESGVSVVTGDTKVVPRGAADQVFVTTTGLGRARPGIQLGAEFVQVGDVLLVSGTLGDHGIAILAARESFAFSGELLSDTGSIHPLVAGLLNDGIPVRWMRDPTRGGVSAVLHELAEAADVTIEVEEAAIPMNPAARGACEVLGLDPLFVANEGKLIAVVPADAASRAMQSLQSLALGRNAAIIGRVVAKGTPEVRIRSAFGSLRVLDEPSGAPMPRIC